MDLKNSLFAFIISLGLVACSDDNKMTDLGTPEGASTYLNLSVHLPEAAAQKALPGDYNPDGDYEGADGVETLDVYIVSASGAIEARRFSGTDISSSGSVVSPSQPFKATSGIKTVYVVINDPKALGTDAPNDNDLISTINLAKIKRVSNKNYDVIMMTGKATSVVIEPDISAQAVVNGANRVAVQLTRTASRIIVTTEASDKILNEDGATVGTISNVTYSIAQGTNQVYFLSQANYITWGTDYVPTTTNYETAAIKYYDYSDLMTPTAVPAKPTASEGYKSLPGKFLFENTHAVGDVKTSKYKKGNTAYVLVRAKFTPEASAIADGGALTNGSFYVGQTDGKIYSSKAAAQTAVDNQKVSAYIGGKMLYYAWANPDNITTPLNSPVLRNHIYHVNITGFGKLGYNWNPLNPDPSNPDPQPVNPDEPEPPVVPTDPLSPEQTYMSVDISVLNWTTHSYNIEF